MKAIVNFERQEFAAFITARGGAKGGQELGGGLRLLARGRLC